MKIDKLFFIVRKMKLAEKILKRSDALIQLKHLQMAIKKETNRRKEFYKWITEEVKAEFVNGEVIVHSPVKKRHWDANTLLSRLLSAYIDLKELGSIGFEKVMISLTRNDYEPDIVFFSSEKVATFKDDQVLFPAPDFVVEILSPKTAKHDRIVKRDDYAMHSIPEYWIIDPVKKRVEQYLLPESSTSYFPPKIHQKGEFIESEVIKGFKIDVTAIFDKKENIQALKAFMK